MLGNQRLKGIRKRPCSLLLPLVPQQMDLISLAMDYQYAQKDIQ